MVDGGRQVMKVLSEDFKLVVVVDGHGDAMANFSQLRKDRSGVYMLRGSVRTIMEQLGEVSGGGRHSVPDVGRVHQSVPDMAAKTLRGCKVHASG